MSITEKELVEFLVGESAVKSLAPDSFVFPSQYIKSLVLEFVSYLSRPDQAYRGGFSFSRLYYVE